ncbi:MAG: protein-L-isoaspartate O-methyltransferase [Gammaproteobacteria bacterium]|nr:protein-L-isoaspartate O-methyltransferase [Gammaproteobacteria bacterium]
MSEMNFEVARHNMIEQQIRPWNVLDQNSLKILQEIPREEFVPKAFKQLAFSDMKIPLAHGQFMLEPKMEAHILQAVQVHEQDHVLEIGTGSGFLTAILAKIAKHVTSLDVHPELTEQAYSNLVPFKFDNIILETCDASQDYDTSRVFDVIIISGALQETPETYKNKLKVGGRLFLITGTNVAMNARLLTRVSDDQWSDIILFETEIDFLINKQSAKTFTF